MVSVWSLSNSGTPKFVSWSQMNVLHNIANPVFFIYMMPRLKFERHLPNDWVTKQYLLWIFITLIKHKLIYVYPYSNQVPYEYTFEET